MTAHTTAKLAAALSEVPGVPREMIQRAVDGYYHDFLSPLDFPEIQLYKDLRELAKLPATPHGSRPLLLALAQRVTEGEFDATKDEAEAWAASAEGQETFRQLAADATFGGIVRDLEKNGP